MGGWVSGWVGVSKEEEGAREKGRKPWLHPRWEGEEEKEEEEEEK